MMMWLRFTIACIISAMLGGNSAVDARVVLEGRQNKAEPTTSTSSTSASRSVATVQSTSSSPAETQTEKLTTQSTSNPTVSSVISIPTNLIPPGSPNPGSVPVCRAPTGPFAPFCLPSDGTEVWVGDTYYITWDADAFPINSTITVGLNYVNTPDHGGKSAYTSPPKENSYGFVTVTMDKAWLQGQSRNNLTVYIVQFDPASSQRVNPVGGPVISLINKPPTHYPPPPPTPVPHKLGLLIGLPLGLAVIFLIACGLCFGMRQHRRIGLGNIMGSGNKGYGSAKSKIERLGGKRRNNGAIRLGELDGPSRYADEPQNLTRNESETYNDMQRSEGNVFRAEIARLKSWK